MAKKIKYEWAHPEFHSNSDANRIGQELASLRDEDGIVDIHDALEWAKENPGSELHNSLEWHNPTAATEWRLHQLRNIVASVRRIDVSGGEVTLRRSHFSVGGGKFASQQAIEDDDELQSRVLSRALKSLEGWHQRYGEVVAMCGGNAAAKKLLKALRDVA